MNLAMFQRKWFVVVALCTVLLGNIFFWPRSSPRAPLPSDPLQPITVERRAFSVTQPPCRARFLAHDLDHLTTTADGVIRAFAANGAGLAINDLDNDGALDLVLGAEAGANTILWNDGALAFTKTTVGEGPIRAVSVIDFDGDGRRDLVLTTNRGAVQYWHNDGQRQFAQRVLPGVAAPAYALAWGDLDQDGDLDLVTASYDAGFLNEIGNEYLLRNDGGVYVYERIGEKLRPTRLATKAQALALALWDLNGDGRLDMIVGNDFAVPDYVWLHTAAAATDGWQAAAPFARTAYSTMSLDAGDINNDATPELFAADMNPYDTAPAVLAQWLPVINHMEQGARLVDDPQVMTNALQVYQHSGWTEVATAHGIDASGWSWSSRFGDLDSDGFLDLYVVNGMIEAGTLAHLPNHELVEENQVYHNDGRGNFVPMPAWRLNSTRSGRSMAMADLDDDGDLDIVVNNLRSRAQLFENQLCGGQQLTVQLQWMGVQNRDAIGAQVILQTAAGQLLRTVRATGGYLAGDAPVLHFGLPSGATITHLDVIWPDQTRSQLTEVAVGAAITLRRR